MPVTILLEASHLELLSRGAAVAVSAATGSNPIGVVALRADPETQAILAAALAPPASDINEWHPLVSSNLKAYRYNAKDWLLDIEFHTGARWRYAGVLQADVQKLATAASPGSFFATVIKPAYTATLLDPAPKAEPPDDQGRYISPREQEDMGR